MLHHTFGSENIIWKAMVWLVMAAHADCWSYFWRAKSVSSVQQHPQQNSADDLASYFQAHVLKPLLGLANEAPGDAQAVIRVIREKLDALETLLDGDEPSAVLNEGVHGATATAPRGAAGSVDAAAANGGGRHGMDGGVPGGRDEGSADLADIGRNQRSRVREMRLLEILSGEARPFSLQQLVHGLAEFGIQANGAAVVSQLHRMKKVGLIEQPANGMYEITQDGLGHLRKLRSSFGAFVRG